MSNKSKGRGRGGGEPKVLRCERCGRRLRSRTGPEADRWTLRTPRVGWPVGVICPDCTTGLEHAEKTVNTAMLKPVVLPGGRGVRLVPKVCGDE